MFNKAQNILLLLCITGCIYILRDHNTSPTKFLKSQAVRILQDLRPSETLCKGVDIQSDVSVTDRDRAATVRSALDNIRDGNPFVDFIQGSSPPSDIGDEYVVPVLRYAVPWIVFFALSIISCFVYTCIWCCRRQSKSDRFKNCYFLLSILFSAFVIGSAIAGLVLSRGIPTGSHRTICRASLLLEELVYGNSTTNWIGVRPAAERVTFILDTFNDTIDSIEAIDNDFTEMTARIQPALAAVQNMYDQNAAQVVQTRPDPDIGGTYVPLYIQNLGPVTNRSTATGLLELEMTTKQAIVEQAAEAVNTGIEELRQNRQQYEDDLNSGREFAQLTTDSVDDVLAKVQEFGVDAGRVIDAINGALIGVLVAKLATAAFAIFMILVVCCGISFFNKCVHMSWCALGLIGILTWALSSLLFPLSLIMFEGCEVADRVISDPQFFDITFHKFVTNETPNTERARQVIKQCLFEDGELLAVFGLQGKVNMFDPIFNALDSTGNLTETVQEVPDSIAIPFNQKTIQSFRESITPDSQETVEDLLKLNGFITAGKQQCSQLQDAWVLNSAQCPAGSGAVFASNNAEGFNFGSATCIGFNAWGTKDINNRYTTTSLPAGTCGDSDVYLSDFVGRFVQSRQEVDTIFEDLQNSLDDVATANTAFMQSVKAVTRRFDPIRENTLTMYNAVANPETGLLHNTNCMFIQESVQNIHDSLCVEAISSLFQATIDIIVLSFMGFFATFFVFCLSRKFSFEKKEGRQIPGHSKAPKV